MSFIYRSITPYLNILELDWLKAGVFFMYFYISYEFHSILPPVWYLHEDLTFFAITRCP